MSNQPLTSRGFVAATPAAVVAATLPALKATAAEPDAELLELAKVFERLHSEWQDLDVAASRLEPPISAHFDRHVHTMDDLWRARRESGYEQAAGVSSDKLDELDVVANRLRELPAKTLQGLAAKARLVQFDAHLSGCAGMEGPERDWDWSVLCMEHFVREIERFAAMAGGAHA